MPITQSIPAISDMSEDYQLLHDSGVPESIIKEMWALNELDVKSGEQDSTSN